MGVMIEKQWYRLSLLRRRNTEWAGAPSFPVWVRASDGEDAHRAYETLYPAMNRTFRVELTGRCFNEPSSAHLRNQARMEAGFLSWEQESARETAPELPHVSAAVAEFEATDDSKGPADAAVYFLLSMASRDADGTYQSLTSYGKYELDYVAGLVAGLRPDTLTRDELETLFEFQSGLFREMRRRP